MSSVYNYAIAEFSTGKYHNLLVVKDHDDSGNRRIRILKGPKGGYSANTDLPEHDDLDFDDYDEIISFRSSDGLQQFKHIIDEAQKSLEKWERSSTIKDVLAKELEWRGLAEDSS